MQTTIRTTVRIRKDLFDQSRLIALKRDLSLQEVINQSLALGLGHISDLNAHQQALKEIDKFRESLRHKKINVQKILKQSKFDLK